MVPHWRGRGSRVPRPIPPRTRSRDRTRGRKTACAQLTWIRRGLVSGFSEEAVEHALHFIGERAAVPGAQALSIAVHGHFLVSRVGWGRQGRRDHFLGAPRWRFKGRHLSSRTQRGNRFLRASRGAGFL